jgi:hypothetical protein
MTRYVNVAVYGEAIDRSGLPIRPVLHRVAQGLPAERQGHAEMSEGNQGTPPRGCYSFADGVLRLAPEDVRQYVGFIVRVWAHPAGRDTVLLAADIWRCPLVGRPTVEYEVHSSALAADI